MTLAGILLLCCAAVCAVLWFRAAYQKGAPEPQELVELRVTAHRNRYCHAHEGRVRPWPYWADQDFVGDDEETAS